VPPPLLLLLLYAQLTANADTVTCFTWLANPPSCHQWMGAAAAAAAAAACAAAAAISAMNEHLTVIADRVTCLTWLAKPGIAGPGSKLLSSCKQLSA
jgi:hypothetical protein